jgi:hypothetical protein
MASKKNVNHVTTPSHLGLSSPAPRNMTSPAANRRDLAGKMPGGTAVGGHASKTLGASPMVRTLSQTGVGSSPTALMGSTGTPLAGLGLDIAGPTSGGTPGQMNLPTPLLGAFGAAMLPSLSGFSGLDVPTSGIRKRNEDEERRLKLRKVLQTIGKAKSRVSEESIARISRRLGLQNDIDAEKLSAEEKERKVGNRTIGIAGKSILIDVELKNHVAQNVAVMFSGEGKTLEEEGAAAGKILLGDLAPKNGILVQTALDSFASHLSHVARLDRLSDGINCFEAIAGLHSSLKRLHEAERTAVKHALSAQKSEPSVAFADDARAESEVIRKRSGKPTMHERGMMGLAVEYWAPRLSASQKVRDDTAMDIDDEKSSDDTFQPPTGVHILRIDVASSSTTLCPPIRVSDGWLPEVLTLPSADSLQDLPWHEPASTYVANTVGGLEADSMLVDAGTKLPDLHFTAKLEPPIIVPMSTANDIFATLGVANSSYAYTSYQAMLLDTPTEDGTVPDVTSTRTVTTIRDGEELEMKHQYTLNVHKPDFGCRLEELPFSHPRQLIELLPTLRQWTWLGSVLRGAFAGISHIPSKPSPSSSAENKGDIAQLSLHDSLKSLAGDGNHESILSVDVEMTTTPRPSLSLTFVDRGSQKIRNIEVQILPNAEILIVPSALSESKLADGNAEAESQEAIRMARALDICSDIGVWLEWLQKRKEEP